MRLQARFRRLSGDDCGTTAVMFGIVSVIVIGIAGAALDTARGYSVRSSLQAALDAAMLATAPGTSDPDANLTEIAEAYIAANWRAKLGVGDITISVTKDGEGQLSGSAAAVVPTTLARLLGFDGLPVFVESQIAAGSRDVEAVLVVDNTGSMAGPKIDALKSSARTLVESVYSGRNADRHAKIGIVPFAQYVNVGMANRNKAWMSVPLDTATTLTNQCYDQYDVIGSSNCRTETATGYNDGVAYTYQYYTCDYQYGPPRQVCGDVVVSSAWHGCAGSRGYPLNTLDQDYGARIPGIMDAWCPSEITPLTNDKQKLFDQINGLVATGNTYIPAGLIWGWRVISKGEPYDEAHDYDEIVSGSPVRKIMVLMTDGANTLSATAPTHDGGDVMEANARTLELCSNIKGKGIEVYTIAFDVIDNGIKDILRDCATAATKFYDAANGGQLEIAFREIARDMLALHLAR